MGDLTPVKLKKRILTCHWCKFRVMTPGTLCAMGHFFCSSCSTRRFCPKCRVPLQVFAQESQLDNLLVICKFSRHGCPAETPLPLAQEHEASCLYQEFPCFICRERGHSERLCVGHLRHHLKELHRAPGVVDFCLDVMSLTFPVSFVGLFTPGFTVIRYLFVSDGQVYALACFAQQLLWKTGTCAIWVFGFDTSRIATLEINDTSENNKVSFRGGVNRLTDDPLDVVHKGRAFIVQENLFDNWDTSNMVMTLRIFSRSKYVAHVD